MRKFTKKFGTILLAGSLLATQMQGGLLTNASSYYADNSDVEDAYDDYYAEHYEDNNNYLGAQSGKIDLNGDSIDEMWVTYAYGVRGAYDFLCYKNGTVKKIKTFKGCCTVRYNEDKKQICVLQSSGAADNSYTTYKFTGSKFKKIATYESSGTFKNDKLKMVYYKDKKRISKSTYNKATRKYNNWDHLE